MYKFQLTTQSFIIANNKEAERAYQLIKEQGVPVRLFRWVKAKRTKRITQPGYYVQVGSNNWHE